MAGIAPQPPQPGQDQPADGKQGPSEVGDEEGLQPNASPEEQQQYDEFVLAGMALIYDKPQAQDGEQQPEGDQKAQVRPGILKLLDNDPSDLKGILNAQELDQFSPLVAIAATTVIIVIEIQKLASDENISDAVVLHGSAAILEELVEVHMRTSKDQLSEDEVHKALSMAADIYREVGADQGLVDENALKDEFQQLVQADKSGKLADISPDLAGINKAADINEQEGADPSPDQQGDQSAPDAQEEQAEPVDNAQEDDEEKRR
jgi:hypothetical protein